jgi:iron complex outermembrane recepter protein
VSRYVQRSLSAALYANTETALNERWSLTAGARLSWDRRGFEGGTSDATGSITGAAPGAMIAQLDETHHEQHATGKLGVNYRLSPGALLYLNASSSYKAGVFYGSPVLSQAGLAYVAPERLGALEAGFKGEALERTLSWSAAAYAYRYKDRQSLVLLDANGSVVGSLGSIPEARLYGAELEVRWKPSGTGFDAQLGVSHNHSRVTRAPQSVRGATLVAPINEGDRLAQSPAWAGHVVLRQEWPVATDYRAAAQLKYSYSGRQIAALADPNAAYGPVRSTGVRLALSPANAQWELGMAVENLQDREDTTYSFSSIDATRVHYVQRPRSAQLSLTYNF